LSVLFAPSVAQADDSPPEPVEISVAIDSIELGPEVGPRVEQKLYGPMSDALRSKGFEAQGPGGAPKTVLTSLAYLDESNSNYAIHIDFIDEQGAMTPLIEGFACMACTERRLIDETLKSFKHATTSLHGAAAGDPPDLPPIPQVTPPPVKQIGPLGYTGIGMSSTGLLMVVVGSGLTAVGGDSRNSSADVVLGIGITALGFGIAAILGDVLKRRRSSERRQNVRIEPASPESGIAFSFGL
jgi:hypothetical protein